MTFQHSTQAEQTKGSRAPTLAIWRARIWGHRFLPLAMLTVMAAGTTQTAADYKNPTNLAHCNMYSDRYEFKGRRDSLSRQFSQCLKQPNQGKWVRIPHCGHGGSERCAQLESKRCQLENHMRANGEMCRARLETHQMREREKKLAEEQAQRERDKFLLEAARHGATPGGLDAGLKPTQNLITGLRGAGRVAGHLIGATPQNAGALHLSSALTTAGLRVTQAIQTAALERFRASMAELQHANPSRDDIGNFGKPTPGRIEATTQLIRDLEALERQIAHAVTLVDHGLPLGGASAVVGEGAEHLIELVYARANGLLATPLSETSLDAAIEAARPGGSPADLSLIEPDTGPLRQESAVSDQLRKQRIAALTDVQGRIESKRRTDAQWQQRQLRERRQAKAGTQQTAHQQVVEEGIPDAPTTSQSLGFSKPDCVHVTIKEYYGDELVTAINNCSYPVIIKSSNIQYYSLDRIINCNKDWEIGAMSISRNRADKMEVLRRCVSAIARR